MARLIFRRKHNNYIAEICIFLLFLTFASLSFVLIMVGADTYRGIKKKTNVTFNSGALLSYIDNKIHAYDFGKIYIKVNEGVDILVLEEENSDYSTYIYCYKKGVYETILAKDEPFVFGEGELLYNALKLSFKRYNDNVIKVDILSTDRTALCSYVNLNAGIKE
mgnify:CR=1 FL=1